MEFPEKLTFMVTQEHYEKAEREYRNEHAPDTDCLFGQALMGAGYTPEYVGFTRFTLRDIEGKAHHTYAHPFMGVVTDYVTGALDPNDLPLEVTAQRVHSREWERKQ